MSERQPAGPPNAPATIFTVGHSTRSLDELIGLLQEHGVLTLVDVRTVPRSHTNPQHNQEALQRAHPARGLRYEWLGKELGGLRKRRKELGDMNGGWENASFQVRAGPRAGGLLRRTTRIYPSARV